MQKLEAGVQVNTIGVEYVMSRLQDLRDEAQWLVQEIEASIGPVTDIDLLDQLACERVLEPLGRVLTALDGVEVTDDMLAPMAEQEQAVRESIASLTPDLRAFVETTRSLKPR